MTGFEPRTSGMEATALPTQPHNCHTLQNVSQKSLQLRCHQNLSTGVGVESVEVKNYNY